MADGRSSHPIRRSPRLAGYDYGQASGYLVSTVVDDRSHRIGEICDGAVVLNDAGQLIHTCWLRLDARFEAIELDDFVVMPNHFHAIIFIGTDLDAATPSSSRVMQVFKLETAVHYGHAFRANAFPPAKRALWQRSFHDRVISSSKALAAARACVQDNPRKWQEERDSHAR